MITIFFAPPGVGKSTLAARFAVREHILKKFKREHYSRILCNFPLKYTEQFDKDDFGFFDMSPQDPDSMTLILYDEMGVDMNNRAYKSMPQEAIRFLKYHRKYHCDIVGFSQSYADMDVTARRLCTRMYLLKKCWFWPYMTKALRITKTISIDENTHDIVDAYEFDPWYLRPFTTKRFYLPFYWHAFDSWDAPKLPVKRYPQR